jgi:putative peptidoglycan lipid II flippase
MAYLGIALATSIASWVNAVLLITTAVRRGHYRTDQRFKSRLPRMVVSLFVMTAVLLILGWLLSGNYAENAGFTAALWGLLVLCLAGAATYFAAAHVTGALRISELLSSFRR